MISPDLNKRAAPLLKWAGGKSHLTRWLPELSELYFNEFYDPFIGGGGLFWKMQFRYATISDNNYELINFYQILKKNHIGLINLLSKMKKDEASYYHWRSISPSDLTHEERAARFYYLNRLCYGGLYRVNKKGAFNVPYGNYSGRTFIDTKKFILAHRKLKNAKIIHADFRKMIKTQRRDDPFIFLDPPYHPPNKEKELFSRYSQDAFTPEMHTSLIEEANKMAEKGLAVVYSNSHSNEMIDAIDKKQFTILSISKRNSFCRNSDHKEIIAISKDLMRRIEEKKQNSGRTIQC